MLDLETQALLTHEELRFPNFDKWYRFGDSTVTLKRQNGFIQEVVMFGENLEISTEKENLISRYNMINNFKVNCCLDLNEVCNKRDINPEEAKVIALETINRRYSRKD